MLRCYRVVRSPAVLRHRLSATVLPFAHPTTSHRRFYRSAAPPSASSSAPAAAAEGVVSPLTSASPVASDAATAAAPQTYFDYLDRVWNAKWFGTVDEHAAAAAGVGAVMQSEPSWFAQAFTSSQQALGIEAGTMIFLVGATTRLCTLVFSLYGERAGERMRLALPELKKPQEEFNRVYYNDLASAMEVQMAASVLKSQRRAVFRKYGTSNAKCIASVFMAPLIMTGLYQVSTMCENPSLDVGSSAFLWCGALTLPDPFFVLPMLTCAITLLNFELSISKDIKTGWMKNVIWGARLGCLCVVPVFASFRAGVCLYFIGMNVAGLLQPLLLRSTQFRAWFGFPSAEAMAAVSPATATTAPPGRGPAMKAAQNSDAFTNMRARIAAAVNPPSTRAANSSASDDVLQARLTAQFPYLSHLLNPQVDEHEELFAKARNKQSKPDVGRRAATTAAAAAATAPQPGSRYARGTNPLMSETPLHRTDAASSHAGTRRAAAASPESANSGAVAAAEAASASATRAVPKKKGTSFASSGWKTAQLSFDESDFIPTYESKTATSSSAPPSSQQTQRK